MVLLAITAGMLLGLWRGSLEHRALASYQPFYGKTAVVKGLVSEDTTYGSEGDQRFRLGNVEISGRELPGTVWASSASSLDIKRGDVLVLEGFLAEGFGNIPAAMYRADVVEAIRPNPGDVARRVRDWFAVGVRRAVPEPEASLGMGFLAGQRSALPELLTEQLRTVGLTHIIVASGYNLTILVKLARRWVAGISKYLATLVASGMIFGFMLVTGFSPSMSRAGLVSGLSLAAWYYGRTIQPAVLLPFAAAITVLLKPAYIWGDVGWYLSFAAFTGVILLAPLLHSFFWGAHKVGFMRELVVSTIAAQITTLPIVLLVFGQLAVFALPANVLVLPAIPLIMLFTFVAGVGGLVLPAVAGLLGLPANLLLQYVTTIVGWASNLPGAQSEVKFTVAWLVASYVALLGIIIVLWRRTKHDFKQFTKLNEN